MSDESSSRPKRTLQPPPDFQSRKMQVRLFVLVAACMGVLYLVTEAARPERWGWFFGQARPAPPPAAPEEIDTRIDDPETRQTEPDVVRIADPLRGTLDETARLEAKDPVSLALADGWSAFFEQASHDDRDLVALGLKALESRQPLPVERATSWSELLEKIDGFWSAYKTSAIKGLEAPPREGDPPALSDEEKQKWKDVLDDVEEAWRADRALLARLAQAEPTAYTDAEREQLRLWQLRWERLSLAAIRDDTVHRPQETDAWFALFDRLQQTDQAQLDKQDAPSVSFVQMFKETDDFRGKLVRFQGRIMQAKPIKASQNVYGIKQQYLLWIQPDDAPKSPVVVYALAMPKDFPTLDSPNLDGGYTKLREDVVVTGYLFKRWAYRAQEGTQVAPLVVTKSVKWQPSPIVTRGNELPSATTFLIWLGACALLGSVVALAIYVRTRALSPAMESFQNSPIAQRELHTSLSTAQAGPGPLEALRLMEQRDQQKGNS